MALWTALTARWRDGDVALDGDIPTTRFGELRQRVGATAAWLQARGVGPGDVVAVQLDKERAFLELFLAAVATGAVFLPINPRATAAETDWIVTDAGARLVIRDAPDVGDAPWPALTEPGPDAIAVQMYTSGTTGTPKGARLSHGNILATVRALHDAWGWRRDDVLLHALPLFHVHGLFVAQLPALMAGARTTWHTAFDAARVLDALPRATVFMGVPTFYDRLLALDLESADLSGVRLFTSGSAGLPAAVHAAFEARTGHAILERYGMTEVGIVLSNPLDGPRLPGRVGAPLPGVEARVVDDTGAPVADGTVGELHVRGPSVFVGYHRRPDATDAALSPDGWMRTGDLAIRWPDGTFAIVGRASELVITGGFNVYPREVEAALLDHPAVAEAAVFGVPDRDAGQRVVAAVVLREATSEEVLRAHVRARLSGYKVPRQVVVTDRLPRNAMGKVQKHLLAARHTPIAIRPATSDDIPWIVAGNRAMAEETEGITLDGEILHAGVRRVFEDDVGARYLVAELGGEPVGQLMITTEWSDWRNAMVWWIQSVYVWPAARHRGVYRALYDAVVRDAQQAGAAGVRLYVDTRNTQAQAVYARLGMVGDHYRMFEAMFDGAGAPPGGTPGPDGR